MQKVKRNFNYSYVPNWMFASLATQQYLFLKYSLSISLPSLASFQFITLRPLIMISSSTAILLILTYLLSFVLNYSTTSQSINNR